MKRRRTWKDLRTQKNSHRASKVCHNQSPYLGRKTLTDIPKDILMNILLRLPVKRILVCKCVCKTLYELISDPFFAKTHLAKAEVYPLMRTLNRDRISRILYLLQPEQAADLDHLRNLNNPRIKCEYYNGMKLDAKLKIPLRNFEFCIPEEDSVNGTSEAKKKKHCIRLKTTLHKYKIVNSCNGLLCLSEPSPINSPAVVCNPVTGEFINLPRGDMINHIINNDHIDCGLGYSPVDNQYKVIRMFTKCTLLDYKMVRDIITGKQVFSNRVAEVYTLGTRRWRAVGHVPHSEYMLAFPTYLNGSLHWFRRGTHDQQPDCIVAFNMRDEKFQPVPVPPTLSDRYSLEVPSQKWGVSMGALRGCLCMCDASGPEELEVWVMEEYGDRESWNKVFSLSYMDVGWRHVYYQPIKYMEDGTLVLFQDSGSALICGMSKFFKVQGVKSEFEALAHTPSLISLKDLVGDRFRVLNVNSRCSQLNLLGESRSFSLVEVHGTNELDNDDV